MLRMHARGKIDISILYWHKINALCNKKLGGLKPLCWWNGNAVVSNTNHGIGQSLAGYTECSQLHWHNESTNPKSGQSSFSELKHCKFVAFVTTVVDMVLQNDTGIVMFLVTANYV